MDQPSTPLNNLCRLAKNEALIIQYFSNSPFLEGILRNAEAIDHLSGKVKFDDADQAFILIIEKNVDRFHQLCNECLNTGHFSAIPDHYRLLYSFCCAVRAKLSFLTKDYFLSLRHCDEGLLKGNDLEDGSLSKFASFLCSNFLPPPSKISENLSKSINVPNSLPSSVQIASSELPSLECFFNSFYRPQLPVLILGMVNGWPALEKWSFSYLNSLCGHRLVPVELGSKYTDDDWRQQLMTFNQYLAEYVFPTEEMPSQPGYMAQHRMLDQIPELRKDVPIPDYCAFGDQSVEDESVDGTALAPDHELTINAFIGPSGTVSPLHTDPRHNLFCQIRGRKFVRLISPQCRKDLYLYDDLMRQNSSQVDVECPDLVQFPNFANIRCYDSVVEAGQCLFIPRGWFHHIRALEPSISISIWFGPSLRKNN